MHLLQPEAEVMGFSSRQEHPHWQCKDTPVFSHLPHFFEGAKENNVLYILYLDGGKCLTQCMTVYYIL
jgi:hypothetical protein